VAGVSLAMLAAGCGISDSGSGSNSGEFTIGAVNSTSGDYASIGQELEAGLKVAIDQINDEGGINGRKVVLISKDDGGDPAKTQLAVKQLVEQEKVDFLFPNALSFLRQVTLPYETSRKVFTISSSSTGDLADPKKYPYSFINGEPAPARPPAMAQALKNFAGGTRVGVLYTDTPSQQDEAEILEDDASVVGLEVVKNTEIPGASTDVTSQLAALRAAGAEIVVWAASYPNSVNVVMTGMQTIGWKAPVFSFPEAIIGDLTDQKVPAKVADQFHSLFYTFATKTDGENPLLEPMQASASELGTASYTSAVSHDVAWLAKWVYEQADEEYGDTSADSLRKAAESVGTVTDFPYPQLVFPPNPGWSADDHTAASYDFTNFYSVIDYGPADNGIYSGSLQETDYSLFE
jgi:branched-chain amino acid transport system substrate-binding protein